MPKPLKKTPDFIQTYGQTQVYFTDEMRYGTRTDCKRRWTRQGRHPQCPVKIGYDWGYLFVALSCFSGDMYAGFYSHLDGECFQHFTQSLAEHCQKNELSTPIALLGDKATAHQAHRLPESFVWLPLPTACPELNPVERFFEEVRKHLANRVFQSKQEVENCLAFWIEHYQNQKDKLIKLTKFQWLECVV